MTRRRYSLAFSVGRDLLLALVACAAATLVTLTVQLETTKDKLRESSLDEAARYVARHLQIDPGGTARFVPTPGSLSSKIGYSVVVLDKNGQILFEEPAGIEPPLLSAIDRQRRAPTADSARATRLFAVAFGSERVVGATLRRGSGDDEQLVAVFKNERAADVLIDEIIRDFPYRGAGVLLPLFIALLLGGGWIVWRRMRPIAQVAQIAGTIGPHTLNLRLPEADLPAEVLPIVQSVNGALERLQHAAEAQREFLRHAAHQLRTPLTVLSARAQALDDTVVAAELRDDIRQLSRIMSQLLGAVGEAVRDDLAASAARQRKKIELARPAVSVLVSADPNVVEIAVRNLVENAVHHSPPGSTIGLRIGADAQVEVVDCGPGIADDLRERIFAPFWSGDPQGNSAGLGLTIVNRIAERYGARVSVVNAPGGGAAFAMHFDPLPLAADAIDPALAKASIPASLAHRRRREALDAAAG